MIPTTVDDMRTELIKFGEDEAAVAAMKKGDLRSKLMEWYNKRTDEDMSFAMENLEDEDSQTLEGAIGVKYASPEWNDYVMGLFQQDELIAGYPKLNGLRRVANYLLGSIVESIPVQVIVIGGAGEKTVVINYKVSIEWQLNVQVGFGNMGVMPQIRTFGGVADCNETQTVFGKHPSATAESKAESRALRKALCINVLTADEVISGEDTEQSGIPRPTSTITPALKSVIKGKCKALSIEVDKLIKNCGIETEFDKLTMAEGQQVFEALNKCQQK